MNKPTTTPAASLAAHTFGEIKWDGTGRLRSAKHGRYLAHDNRSAGYGGYTGEEEGANQARLAVCWNACEKYFPQSDPAAGIAALRGALEIIERGACLQQINHGRCICYSCIARAALAGKGGGE